ncbi:MAG: cobalamin-dependent protein [Pseudomonadota bacterium]|nr:cobalamin-dependent protein [Pseudomonadota bacterium]
MAIKISFADLTHTGQIVAANTTPLGISYVLTYAKQELGNEIECEIFKYPEDLSEYLDSEIPQIACFSNFSWNLKIGHEFARRIKEFSPNTITVFGGPNFPESPDEQHDFLASYPAIDCYVEFEGEEAFVKLFKALKKVNYNWSKFKESRTIVPNIRYLDGNEMIAYELDPRIRDVNTLPSPYENGHMDKFFDDVLIPMIQTTRGCPFKCTFCWEGGNYFNKVGRFSRERVTSELNYMKDRCKVPDLQITDANFGAFKQDIETAKDIRNIQQKHSWPMTVLAATSKNNKKRTIEVVKILGATLPATAAVQSTDMDVLDNVKRNNVKQDVLVTYATEIAKMGGQSEAEIILCLEGDTKEKHFKTVSDMLDANMKFIRLYQYMMIPGTQAVSKERREEFGLETKYRVLPRCFGQYTFRGEVFPVAEIEEIVIANNTMPYEDYQACRNFDLTVEIFNNDSILADLISFLGLQGIKRSEYIKLIHSTVIAHPVFSKLYVEFSNEEKKNLSDHERPLEEFTEKPGVIEQYIDGEYGTNEIYKYRAIAVFHHIELLHELAYRAARSLLKEKNSLNDNIENYFSELCEFSLMRKSNALETTMNRKGKFHFDFIQLMNSHFEIDPFDVYVPEGITVEFYHSKEQIDLIGGYEKQYGTDMIGLGRILLKANMDRLYRRVRSTETEVKDKGLSHDDSRKGTRFLGR